MRVSSRADYGVRALFELARRFGQGPTQSREIAARQAIPEAYLHQLLGALNRAGLVRSTRGPLGGHEIALDPADVTLWDVFVALEGQDRQAHPHFGARQGVDIVHQTWHELLESTTNFLQGITLRDLVDRHEEQVLASQAAEATEG
jgi:Rrf2 family transcriptional regulator, cysteine metabolism repressor